MLGSKYTQPKQQVRIWETVSPDMVLQQLGEQDFHIPMRFERKIVLHFAKNILAQQGIKRFEGTPLVLGIQGPSGDGKSWQTRVVCAKRLRVPIIYISGASLSSDLEGMAAVGLRDAYKHGCSTNSGRVVLLIDDFDTSVVSVRKNVYYTVNTQLVSGALMDIASNPQSEETPYRVPIIATGNNFKFLYKPLMRHGRMDLFAWKPSPEERRAIVVSMFSDSGMRPADISEKLVGRFSSQHIDFFARLRNAFLDEELWAILEAQETVDIAEVRRIITARSVKYDIDRLVEIGDQLAKTEPEDFLSESEDFLSESLEDKDATS